MGLVSCSHDDDDVKRNPDVSCICVTNDGHELGFASKGSFDKWRELKDMREDAIEAMNDLDPNDKNYEGKVEDLKVWIETLENRMDALVIERR